VKVLDAPSELNDLYIDAALTPSASSIFVRRDLISGEFLMARTVCGRSVSSPLLSDTTNEVVLLSSASVLKKIVAVDDWTPSLVLERDPNHHLPCTRN
jgi:hypothetical protein